MSGNRVGGLPRPYEIRWRGLAALALLALACLWLGGCVTPEEIVPVPPTAANPHPTWTPEPEVSPVPRPNAATFPLPAPVSVGIDRPPDTGCVGCHTDEEEIQASMAALPQDDAAQPLSEGQDWSGELPPMEAWEKVYLDRPEFFDTLHGRYGCPGCHGGNGDTKLKEAAHTGLIAAPSVAGVCGDCHAEEVTTEQTSLHTNLTGYRTVLAARSAPEKMPQLEMMMGNHCEPCHTATCGQCHVSRPARLGGGLVAGHLFEDTPAINLTCAGCHGSRIEREYKGHDETMAADVHWQEGRMVCSDCHSGTEFHGTVEEFIHRYDGPPMPSCARKTCHPDVADDDGIEQHGDNHLKLLSCQACHSTAYRNCKSCHVAVENGTSYFEVEPPQLAFKIGRNPIQGRYRPWKFVPVRHVPVVPDSFAYYGQDLLPNFDALPTWKYTTPHNIQRITPQTESCNACHGNADVFLTARDVANGERAANSGVVLKSVPEAIEDDE